MVVSLRVQGQSGVRDYEEPWSPKCINSYVDALWGYLFIHFELGLHVAQDRLKLTK